MLAVFFRKASPLLPVVCFCTVARGWECVGEKLKKGSGRHGFKSNRSKISKNDVEIEKNSKWKNIFLQKRRLLWYWPWHLQRVRLKKKSKSGFWLDHLGWFKKTRSWSVELSHHNLLFPISSLSVPRSSRKVALYRYLGRKNGAISKALPQFLCAIW